MRLAPVVMVSQKQSGKAFEYAVVLAAQRVIGSPNIVLIDNLPLRTGEQDFHLLDPRRQTEDLRAAVPALEQLVRLEPCLALAKSGLLVIHALVQPDEAGKTGDVRDTLLFDPSRHWEIGLSAKHHHEALKHSRLSMSIDFGAKWLGMPCSQEYFEAIAPVFKRLTGLKAQGMVWAQVPNKESEIVCQFDNWSYSHLAPSCTEYGGRERIKRPMNLI
ncbi:MAG TPA: HaeIII family restriction endonuclease [Candidatus Obscuribacterales bacterium]